MCVMMRVRVGASGPARVGGSEGVVRVGLDMVLRLFLDLDGLAG